MDGMDGSPLYLNLYLDESGFSYIGQNKYRFFLLTALIITPQENQLANLLFSKWRKKYLSDSNKCLHAADFFEDHKKGYKPRKLYMSHVFTKAVKDLEEIISKIEFYARVFYIDLPQIRKLLMINEPPLGNGLTRREYNALKREYSRRLQIIHGSNIYLPLIKTLENSFIFHADILEKSQKQDILKRSAKAYINIESQKNSDIQLINTFHKNASIVYKKFGEDIVGLNLHTKGSLDAGIELADLISYISFQTLRNKCKLKYELKHLTGAKIKLIKNLRTLLRGHFKVKLQNVLKTKKATK